ncbi:MAG: cysteine desulfurase family protein [Patescibacteria group bacterium]
MKSIYLDCAAATHIDPRVFKKMLPYLTKKFGNPSALYSLGREAKAAIENARKDVAGILDANPEEIIFTGSGTESDNLALFGVARAYKKYGKHIIVSKIEHKAVLEATKKLEKDGFEITYLNVDSKGIIKISEFKKALRPDTILVSIMYANNEIGTIQPIEEISKIIREFRIKNLEFRGEKKPKSYILNPISFPIFHTDACQAANYLSLDIKKLGVDLITLNGSKIYGPKGVGCLYKAEYVKLEPIIVGGGQENGFRAGTENTALIVGFAEALKLAEKLKNKESQRLRDLRDYFIKNLLKSIPSSRLNGYPVKRLPNNINVSIAGVEGEALVLMLDKYGISASTGSACASLGALSSHVLAAIGVQSELARGSLRLTIGRRTTKSDIDYVLKILLNIVKKLRQDYSII